MIGNNGFYERYRRQGEHVQTGNRRDTHVLEHLRMCVCCQIADDLRMFRHRISHEHCKTSGDVVPDLGGGDPILHRVLDRIPFQPPHNQVRIPRPNIDEQVQDGDFQLVRCMTISSLADDVK